MNTKQQREYRKANLSQCRSYNRNYARRNRKRIAAERKAAMQDPDHAEAARKYFSDYWRRRATGEHIPSSPPLYYEFDGKDEQVFRTSEAARLLHCSTATICQWHKKEWLPDPLMIRGRRLYRRYQVDLMGVLLSVRRRDFATRAKVLKFISANW